MKVVIAGGTGFVGKALVNELVNKGHKVIILTRMTQKHVQSSQIQYIEWLNGRLDSTELEGAEVIINLAGESINNGRWTEKRKAQILSSRIETTTEIIKLITQMKKRPKTLINASAIGYYGTSETKEFSEDTCEVGNDFLASTVSQWEYTAQKAEVLGVRTVLCRFGIILSKHGGALPRMSLPYLFFAGGTVGSGNQWNSWIHLEDVVKAILFIINCSHIQGPVNFTAPNPVSMKEFGQAIGKALNRPHWLQVPAYTLKLLLGEMSTLILEGQKVLPTKLLKNEYPFSFPTLEKALLNIYKKEY